MHENKIIILQNVWKNSQSKELDYLESVDTEAKQLLWTFASHLLGVEFLQSLKKLDTLDQGHIRISELGDNMEMLFSF